MRTQFIKILIFASLWLCASQGLCGAAQAPALQDSRDSSQGGGIFEQAFADLPYSDIPDGDLTDAQRGEIAEILRARYGEYLRASEAIAERLEALAGERVSAGGGAKGGEKSEPKKSSSKSLKTGGSKGKSAPSGGATPMPVDLPGGGSDDASKAVLSVACKGFDGMSAGTAFIARMRGNLFVVTNLHVVRDAEEISMRTINGQDLSLPKTMYIAKNQDAVLLPIKELPEGTLALDMLEDVPGSVSVGDRIVACGNSQGKGSFLRSAGEVVAIGPSIIEMNCAIFKGNSGSPIYHANTRKAIGVVSHLSMGASNPFDAATRRRSNSPIKNSMRYFGQRIDSTKHWEKVNMADFMAQCRDIRMFEEKIGVIEAYESKKALVMGGYAYDDFYKIVRPFSAIKNYSNAYKTEARNCFEALSNLMKHEAASVRARKFSPAFDSDVNRLLGFFEKQRQVYEERAKSFDR